MACWDGKARPARRADVCGGRLALAEPRIARIEISSGLGDLFVTLITAGIIRPFSVEVWEVAEVSRSR